MLTVPPIDDSMFRKEAIAMDAGKLRKAFLWIYTISRMDLTALAFETIIGVPKHADLVAHFEAFAFSGRVDLGNDSNSFMADRNGSLVLQSNTLHNV